MNSFDIRLNNYRCFSSEAPLRLSIRPDLVSLVGPNNGGKSTLLKLFYEMRNVFAGLADNGVRELFVKRQAWGSTVQGVGDPVELFHNLNDRPLRVELRIPGCELNQLSGVDLIKTRANASAWTGDLYTGPEYLHVDANHPLVKVENLVGSLNKLSTDQFVKMIHVLSNSMYLPSSRIAIGESQGDHYDLKFGNGFISLWDQWKTGDNRINNEAIQKVTEDIAKVFGFKRLEITATPDGRDLHTSIDGKPFKLRELGAGLAQFIIVLANVAVKKPSLLLIDEPEISLHPSLQLDFLTTLASYVKDGPTMFATHSLGLARSADRVFSFRRSNGRSEFSSFEETGSFDEFLGEMSFSAYRELGYSAVLLVEGVNDIKTAQQFLRRLDKDHSVVVMQLGGSQMINGARAKELAEVLRLTKNVHVLIDSEKSDSSADLAVARKEFLENCEGLGIRAVATERRALEHYLTETAVKVAFGDAYRCLAPFEQRSSATGWAKSASWKAAREMSIEDLLATDVGQFLADV